MKQDKLIIAIFSLLVVIIGSITVGFFIGRSTETEIRYIKGETIRDTIRKEVLLPTKEYIPSDPIYIYKDKYIVKTDTVIQVIDSAAIINDWILQRNYSQTLFDNQNGKLNIDLSVRYNKLQSLEYSFTPIHKEINTYKAKVWQPYLSGSYSTFNYVGLGGGFFYHNLGIEYQFQKDFRSNSTGHSFGLKYKF